MSEFLFEARDEKGRLVKGHRDSNSSESVAAQLLKENLFPIKVTPVKHKRRSVFTFLTSSVSQKITLDDMLMFSQQMYALSKAGIPLLVALNRLAETTGNPKLAKAITDVAINVAGGQKLGASLQRHPTVFPTILIRLVEVGEESGQLDSSFLQVANYFDLESTTRKSITSVFRYPLIVITSLVAAIIVINFFVIPAFQKAFAMFNADLPLPTRIILGTSNFLLNYWYYILAVVLLIVIAFTKYVRTPQGEYNWAKYQLRIPIIGKIIEKILYARFARTFSLIIRSGITLNQGLELVAGAVNNAYARKAILRMSEMVEHGENLTRAAAEVHILSPLTLQMLSVGEETGSIDNMMLEVAQFYEREIEHDLKKLNDVMEPILLFLVASMVLVLALGVFLPMWDLTKVAR